MNQNSQKKSSSSTADETAICALYRQMMEGWNAASGYAFACPFEENGDLVGFDGTYIKGRQEIAFFHQHLFDMFLKGSRLVGKARSVRFLTSDIAVKRNGKWSLAAFQNTRATYIGRPDESQKLTEELQALL